MEICVDMEFRLAFGISALPRGFFPGVFSPDGVSGAILSLGVSPEEFLRGVFSVFHMDTHTSFVLQAS